MKNETQVNEEERGREGRWGLRTEATELAAAVLVTLVGMAVGASVRATADTDAAFTTSPAPGTLCEIAAWKHKHVTRAGRSCVIRWARGSEGEWEG